MTLVCVGVTDEERDQDEEQGEEEELRGRCHEAELSFAPGVNPIQKEFSLEKVQNILWLFDSVLLQLRFATVL